VRSLSKLCDAADWSDQEFDRIIRSELAEEPRFHRKQWEFAQIFRALHALGFLNPASRGLSMGGGDERLLYAVARRAGHLTVTDLYERGSAWAGARTDDPDRAIKAAAPFPIEPSRLTARRMDMRALEFDDASFDFCYSSCAIEHIGHYADFLRHLQEVRRVLKDDGVYALTTEFHYGEEVIPAPHNYYFSSGYLDDLIKAASFATVGGVDGALSRHALNHPIPANLTDLCADPADAITSRLLDTAPHLQLLTGCLPFTSMSLVLRKSGQGRSDGLVPMPGLDESRRLIGEGVHRWKTFVENARLSLDPFGLWGERRTRAVPRLAAPYGDPRLFHTGYIWLGGAARSVTVDLEAWPASSEDAVIEVRVHRHPAREPDNVVCCATTASAVHTRERIRTRLPIPAEDGCSYAVLGEVTRGACWMDDPAVQITARTS
jgi:SAM-dependent methyltransferase